MWKFWCICCRSLRSEEIFFECDRIVSRKAFRQTNNRKYLHLCTIVANILLKLISPWPILLSYVINSPFVLVCTLLRCSFFPGHTNSKEFCINTSDKNSSFLSIVWLFKERDKYLEQRDGQIIPCSPLTKQQIVRTWILHVIPTNWFVGIGSANQVTPGVVLVRFQDLNTG